MIAYYIKEVLIDVNECILVGKELREHYALKMTGYSINSYESSKLARHNLCQA